LRQVAEAEQQVSLQAIDEAVIAGQRGLMRSLF
jgi:hypothetical protein